MPDPYITKAEEICPKKKIKIDLLDKRMTDGLPTQRFENERVIGFNECLSLCLPIVAELLKEKDELIDKIAEIFHEQLKGVYAADPISALEAIADMIDDRDSRVAKLLKEISQCHNDFSEFSKKFDEMEVLKDIRIADLLKRVDELSNSAQFRRCEEQQRKISELEAEISRLKK